MSKSTKDKIHTMPFKVREIDASLENSGMHNVGSGTGKSDFATDVSSDESYQRRLVMEAPKEKSAGSEIERLEKMIGLIGEKFGKGKITEGLPFLTCSPPWDIGISNGLDIKRIEKDIERRKKLTVEDRESEDSATDGGCDCSY